VGREARRQRWNAPVDLHILGMGASYVVMLTAFYVDNGKNLPIWRHLPHVMYWLVPSGVGVPLIVRALRQYRNIISHPDALPMAGLGVPAKSAAYPQEQGISTRRQEV
jgi:hypothetical protein